MIGVVTLLRPGKGIETLIDALPALLAGIRGRAWPWPAAGRITSGSRHAHGSGAWTTRSISWVRPPVRCRCCAGWTSS